MLSFLNVTACLTLTLTDDLYHGNTEKVFKRNTHVEYESLISYHSKVMASVKIFSGKCDLDVKP